MSLTNHVSCTAVASYCASCYTINKAGAVQSAIFFFLQTFLKNWQNHCPKYHGCICCSLAQLSSVSQKQTFYVEPNAPNIVIINHQAQMTSVDIWTSFRWSWPPTEQTRWILPCYVLVVWTERLSSPCLTAGRNVLFSLPSPVKWTFLRRST